MASGPSVGHQPLASHFLRDPVLWFLCRLSLATSQICPQTEQFTTNMKSRCHVVSEAQGFRCGLDPGSLGSRSQDLSRGL